MNQDNQTKADSQESVYYCYVLMDPRKPGNYRYKTESGFATFDHEPFYVGKGKGNRSHQHLREGDINKEQNHKNNRIRSIRRDGLEVIVHRTKGRYDENKAFETERALIAAIGRRGNKAGPLTNLTDGGEGASNPAPEVRARRSAALKASWSDADEDAKAKRMANMHKANFGRTPDEATRRKMSQSKLGVAKPHTDEWNAKIGQANKGKKRSVETREAMSKARKGKPAGPCTEEKRRRISEVRKNSIRVKCIHCGMESGVPQITRWHNDNCVNKKV